MSNLILLPDPINNEPMDIPITEQQYAEYDRRYDERLYTKFCKLFPISKRREAGWLLTDCAFAILGVAELEHSFEDMTAFLARASSVEYAVDRACRFLRNFPERRETREPRLMVCRNGHWVQLLTSKQARPGEQIVTHRWEKKRWVTVIGEAATPNEQKAA